MKIVTTMRGTMNERTDSDGGWTHVPARFGQLIFVD